MFRAALVVGQPKANKLNKLEFGYGVSVVRLFIQRTNETLGNVRVTRDGNSYTMHSAGEGTAYTFICESQHNPVIDCTVGGEAESELQYKFRVGTEFTSQSETDKSAKAELSVTEEEIPIGELSIGFSAKDGGKMSVGVRPEVFGTPLSSVFPYAWFDIPRTKKSEHSLDHQGHQFVASTEPNGTPADLGFSVAAPVLEVEQNDIRWYIPSTAVSGVIKFSTGKRNLVYLPLRNNVDNYVL